METSSIKRVRQGSDVGLKLTLTDSGVPVDWSSLTDIVVLMYSDEQRVVAGECAAVHIDESDSEILVCEYSADKPQFCGFNSVVVRCRYFGRTKTFDARALIFVERDQELGGQDMTLVDPVVDVALAVEEVSTSLLDNAIAAAFDAAEASRAQMSQVETTMSGYAAAEADRQSNEAARQAAETEREDAMARISEEAGAALEEASQAKQAAEDAAEIIGGNETQRQINETQRQANETQRQNAETLRDAQAQSDHLQAGLDHSTATSDHSTAQSDHSTATSDHTQATTDHTTAASDHTQAGNDHTQAATDHTQAATDHTQAQTDHSASEEATERANAAAEAAEDAVETMEGTYAKKDGYYEEMGVGIADNLASKGSSVPALFIRRTAGGNADIADGNAKIASIRGRVLKFNQLVYALSTGTSSAGGVSYKRNSDGTQTLNGTCTAAKTSGDRYGDIEVIEGHKYAKIQSAENFKFTFSNISPGTGWSDGNCIFTPSSTRKPYFLFSGLVGQTYDNQVCWANIFDLTQMFGAGNEPSTIEEFEAWLAENVGLSYYPYDKGSLVPMQASGIKTIGFNAYNPTTGKARLLGGHQYQITGAYTAISYTDIFGTAETITPDVNGKFTPTNDGELSVTGGNSSTTCVHLVWSGVRDGEYEEHWEQIRNLDLSAFDVQYTAADGTTKVAGGLKQAGSVYDEQTPNKDIRKIGVVDLGSLSWMSRGEGLFSLNAPRITSKKDDGKLLCIKYAQHSGKTLPADGEISSHNSYNNHDIIIRDTAYSTPEALKAALAGVLLYYELATPVETIPSEPHNLAYKVSDFGTEELVATGLTAPIDADIVYGMNAVDTLRNLPRNFVSATQEQNFSEQEKRQARKNIGIDLDGTYDKMVVGTAKNLVDTKGEGAPQEFVRRTSAGSASIAGDGTALIKKVKGNTIVWNKIVNNTNNYNFDSFVADDNNIVTATFGVNSTTYRRFGLSGWSGAGRSGHTYIMIFNVLEINSANVLNFKPLPEANTGFSSKQLKVGANYFRCKLTAATTSYYRIQIGGGPFGEGEYIKFHRTEGVSIFDLTMMFGEGNEPSIEEFKALFPATYYPSNAGQLLSLKADTIVTDGFNQFDGSKAKVFGGKAYYINGTYSTLKFAKTIDGEQTDITPTNNLYTPAEDGYIFATGTGAEFCINLSWSGYRNGEHEPYWQETRQLPALTNFDVQYTGADGETHTEGGLKSAGDVFDEQISTKDIRRIGVVDLGALSWSKYNGVFYAVVSDKKLRSGWASGVTPSKIKCARYGVTYFSSAMTCDDKKIYEYSNSIDGKRIVVRDDDYSTAAEFKTAVAGTLLYYVLATPVETEVPSRNLTYKVADFGTEEVSPQGVDEQGVPLTAPFRADIKYSDDFVRQLVNMPKSYQSQESMDAMLSALGTALGFTYTKTWDATNGKWTYSITMNS